MANSTATANVVVVDSVTALTDGARDHVVICASHGGEFPAVFAARIGVRGIVFNDAAVGKDEAGIAGLRMLQRIGIPAAAVDHHSAAIGDGASAAAGVVSHANAIARALGVAPGLAARVAASLMTAASPAAETSTPLPQESRHLLRNRKPRVWALDSASLVTADDAGDVVLTGSHGELLGGRPEAALKADALAAVFNDAGNRGALPGRLTALDERRIPAATVDAHSARIGDGRSTYFDGVVSAVNRTAQILGARRGMTARAFTDMILAASGDSRDGAA